MLFPPPLTRRHALFLDFDGTLADLAPQPDAVRLAPGLAQDLHALHHALGGALAIVTGRTLADMDGFLGALELPLACEHGAQLRLSAASGCSAPPLELGPLLQTLDALAASHPGLLVERKRAGAALHYRQAPHLQQLCHDTLARAVAALPGAELLAGKYVYEIKPAGAGKGRAIAHLMQQPPFAGRVPLFVGDDVTDEDGFAAVQALGGTGLKVGAGETAARTRIPSPAAVRDWLHGAAQALATDACEATP
ncbi:trehalose-phosphatase [Pulveribacter suum]|uniref:Trehalose 6-phosphate phosphatase n=1 Tax=Pulveribacter suum TaxID=2116657 RepID=A0A2P1NIM3_9BURK|nr:trehalose-phosphatase [Pulveribacter suum]AVP56830.1 trehalose-phosphatase [Pulveribacter suum]